MLESYATGLTALVILSAGWVAVQFAWRKVFPQVGSDPDTLVGRPGCHGCSGATESCDRRPSPPSEEGIE